MRYALAAAVFCLIAACGQKGNLYLREAPPPGVRPAKPEPYQPVPYPKETADEAGAKK